jgi:hypothetical protein
MIETFQSRGEAICRRMTLEMQKLGFSDEQLLKLRPVYSDASFETSRDPYSGEAALCGSWRDARGQRIGEIKFHGDGSFFAEYDVVLPHPTDARWFVEGVTAWGRDETIKAEPKLLAALGD